MNSKPLVTVFIPSYNYERFLEQCVRSVWEQTYRPLELIVNDDGSTDGSMELLKKLQPLSPVPMHIHQSSHGGVSASMNYGLEHANGELWAVVAADDYLAKERIATQVTAFLDMPSAVLGHSEYTYIDEHGAPIGDSLNSELPPPAKGDSLRDLLLLRTDVRSVGIMMRTGAMRQLGGYDSSLRAEDWQMTLRLAKLGPFLHTDERLVFRRIHGKNFTFEGPRTKRKFDLKNDVLIDILREVCPPELDVDAVIALHAATALRGLAAMGLWSMVSTGLTESIAEVPRHAPQLAANVSRGLLSYAWVRAVKPRLPVPLTSRLRELKLAVKRFRERDRR